MTNQENPFWQYKDKLVTCPELRDAAGKPRRLRFRHMDANIGVEASERNDVQSGLDNNLLTVAYTIYDAKTGERVFEPDLAALKKLPLTPMAALVERVKKFCEPSNFEDVKKKSKTVRRSKRRSSSRS